MLVCPQCKGKTKVTDSRPNPDGHRRRHDCLDCKYRFTTQEIIVPAHPGRPTDLGPWNPTTFMGMVDTGGPGG